MSMFCWKPLTEHTKQPRARLRLGAAKVGGEVMQVAGARFEDFTVSAKKFPEDHPRTWLSGWMVYLQGLCKC